MGREREINLAGDALRPKDIVEVSIVLTGDTLAVKEEPVRSPHLKQMFDIVSLEAKGLGSS